MKSTLIPGDTKYHLGSYIQQITISRITTQLTLLSEPDVDAYCKQLSGSLDLTNVFDTKEEAAVEWLSQQGLDRNLGEIT